MTFKNQQTGIRRLPAAIRHSLQGLRAAWREEVAFRQECAVAAVCIPLAFWLTPVAAERALLIGVLGLVLLMELVNSAIEAALDRIGDDEHPLAARAKDLGSAAVFSAIVLAVLTWGLVLGG